MPGPPQVTVVIPCYGVAAYIRGCLESVFAQTFQDFEVIVVNDGSPDTPAFERELAPFLPRVRYIKRENGGVAAARNTALSAAQGTWIAGIDPDDLWTPQYLETQMGMLAADPSLDVIYGDAEQFGEGSPYAGRNLMADVPSRGEVTFESLIRGDCTVTAVCTVARREMLLKAGMFDEALRTGEDYDMWLRVIKAGGKIAYHRQKIARYRRRPESLTADAKDVLARFVLILKKAGSLPGVTDAEQAAIQDRLRYVEACLQREAGRDALHRGDPREAARRLKAANSYFHSPKLSVICWAALVAPQLLRFLHRRREGLAL